MNIGILKENSTFEHRVGLSPSGVNTLVGGGHTVYVQQGAGAEARFTDEEYRQIGAMVVYSAEEILHRSDIVVKVAPPTDWELSQLHEGQVCLSALNLGLSSKKTIDVLLEKKVTAIAFELIENDKGDLAVLQVMSEIAGQVAIQEASHFLQVKEGGRGVLLGSIPGVAPASVVILGAGTVGRTAARVALGMGASVSVLDKELTRLRELEHLFQWRISTAMATPYNIAQSVRETDVLIAAVLLKGEKTPHLVTNEMVQTMKPGSVIVDVSIDQGGCVETSRPTRPDNPVFVEHGVLHYCIPNITSVVARTSTVALTNAILPYLLTIGEHGTTESLRSGGGLAKGVCTHNGFCTSGSVARLFGQPYTDLQKALARS